MKKHIFVFLMLLPFALFGGCVEQQQRWKDGMAASMAAALGYGRDAGADTGGDVEEVADVEEADVEEAGVDAGVVEEKETGGGQEDEHRFPESVTKTMMEQCMGRMRNVQECECGIKTYQKTHRPEDYSSYDSDLMIAAAECRRNQHRHPKWAVRWYVEDLCVKDYGMDRDECECAIAQIQLLQTWVDSVRIMEDRIKGSKEITVAVARCVKNQHRYPKGWADDTIRSCVADGNTLAGCKCQLEKDQELERLEDHVRRRLYGEQIPLNVLVAEARCWKDQHHYPPYLVKRLMDRCTSDGYSEDFCTCKYETIQKELSYVDFRRGGTPLTKAFHHAHAKCATSTTPAPSNQHTF